MLLVLPPTKTNLATLFLARKVRTLDRGTTFLFNLVCSNVAKQVARFLLPVLSTAALVLFCIVSLVFKLLFPSRIM